MASVSGSKVSYTTSDGGSSKQHAILNYTKSETATQVKITCTSGVLARDAGVTVTPSYWEWTHTATGQSGTQSGTPASASYGTGNVTCFSANHTHTYIKGHSAATKTLKFTTQYIKKSGQPKSTATLSVTVPPLASYKVTYNNNGGSGTHAAQTKWYGESLTLTTGTHPTRTGYTFAGWYTAATGGTSYGSTNRSYTSNAALTLYAHWTENTYTLSYNANGGSGAPESHTRLYTATGTVSSVIPTRHLYRFAGWNTSSDGTGTSYLPGATIPANTLDIVLYAQWVLNYTKPVITSVSAVRVNSAGVESDGDDATYADISVSWAIDTLPDEGDINAVDSLTATLVKPDSTTQAISLSGSTAGDSGVGTARVSGLSVDNAYSVIFTLADTEGNATLATLTISRQQFQVDYSPEGGIGFGTSAAARKLFSVAMDMAVSSWAGVIQMFAGSTPPAGWLLCDGSAVSRTDYATLYAAIGDTWGAGDGSTTFNLPDLRGRAPIGAGTGSGLTARTLGNTLGSESLQSHTHTISNHVHSTGQSGTTYFATVDASGISRRQVGSSGTNRGYAVTTDSTSSYDALAWHLNTGNPTSNPASGSAGAGDAQNMQPSAVVNFIIHTGKTN